MEQTLVRRSDIRLTLGVYTHVELPDRCPAIDSLPAPVPRQQGGEVDAAQSELLEGRQRSQIGMKTVTSVGPDLSNPSAILGLIPPSQASAAYPTEAGPLCGGQFWIPWCHHRRTTRFWSNGLWQGSRL